MDVDMMPDLSHLSEEERRIIEEVLQRQKVEEDKEKQTEKQAQRELEDIERQIKERVDKAQRLIGTQDDAICQICQKTKFADGIGHKCHYCQLRSCARCGSRTQIKAKDAKVTTPISKPSDAQVKNIWACSLCQKKQTILAKTGKWFHGADGRLTTPEPTAPNTPTSTTSSCPAGTPFPGPGAPSAQQIKGSQSRQALDVDRGPAAPTRSASQTLSIGSQQQQQGRPQEQQPQRTSGGTRRESLNQSKQNGPSPSPSSAVDSRSTAPQSSSSRPEPSRDSASVRRRSSRPEGAPQDEHRPSEQTLNHRDSASPSDNMYGRTRVDANSGEETGGRKRRPSTMEPSLEQGVGDRGGRSHAAEGSNRGAVPPTNGRDRKRSVDYSKSAATVTESDHREPNGRISQRDKMEARYNGESPRQRDGGAYPTPEENDERRLSKCLDYRSAEAGGTQRRGGESSPVAKASLPRDNAIAGNGRRQESPVRGSSNRQRSPPPQSSDVPNRYEDDIIRSRSPEFENRRRRTADDRRIDDHHQPPPPEHRRRPDRQEEISGDEPPYSSRSSHVHHYQGPPPDVQKGPPSERGRAQEPSATISRYAADEDARYCNRLSPVPPDESAYDTTPTTQGLPYRDERTLPRQRPEDVRPHDNRRPSPELPYSDRHGAGGRRSPDLGYRGGESAKEYPAYTQEVPTSAARKSTSRSPDRRLAERYGDQQPTTSSRYRAPTISPESLPDRARPPRQVAPDRDRVDPAAYHSGEPIGESKYHPDHRRSPPLEERVPGRYEDRERAKHGRHAYGGGALPKEGIRDLTRDPYETFGRRRGSQSRSPPATSAQNRGEVLSTPINNIGGTHKRSSRVTADYAGHRTEYYTPRDAGAPSYLNHQPPVQKANKHHRRAPKLSSRLQRSFSSSDEEVRSTPECSCEDVELDSESFSDRVKSDRRPKVVHKEDRLMTKIRTILTVLFSCANCTCQLLYTPLTPAIVEAKGECLNKLSSRIRVPGDAPGKSLAQCMVIQTPITWQPSADGLRMIGHMILHKQSRGRSTIGDSSSVLGLKVVGGRRTDTGRTGAFVTKVKSGSIADFVGRLRPGDEVLEWNGRPFQDATYEEVYNIINESKHDSQVELIVSRPTPITAGPFSKPELPVAMNRPAMEATVMPHMVAQQASGTTLDRGAVLQQPLPSNMTILQTQTLSGVPGPPVVMITGPQDPSVPMGSITNLSAFPASTIPVYQQSAIPVAQGQIFGRVQISLYYDPLDCQLMITVFNATDLAPRPDGSGRNPYLKLFLLPDRSEKSKRKSKTIVGTTSPVWQQTFLYPGLRKRDLGLRVVEITVWDYDRYATNEFMGEVLLDLSVVPLDNEPRWYTLADMDNEAPERRRMLVQRMSKYHSSEQVARASSSVCLTDTVSYDSSFDEMDYGDFSSRRSWAPGGYRSDSGTAATERNMSMPRSRTYHSRPRHPLAVSQDDDSFEMGYFSDHGNRSGQSRAQSVPGARFNPRAPHIRPVSPTERDQRVPTMEDSRRHLPQIPGDIYGEEAMRELGEKVQQLKLRGYISSQHRPHHRSRPHPPRGLRPYGHMSPQCGESSLPGYLSDGSEASIMSVTSTQSERPRTKTAQEFQNSLETAAEEREPHDETQDGTMSDSAVGSTGGASSGKREEYGKRRKSNMMSRLIPGRASSAQSVNDRRTGFCRSEEVGVPSSLSPQSSIDLTKQTSKESTDSSESMWMPTIQPGEGTLGEFIKGLGQGQIAGRQVLASPVMGEIQLNIADRRGVLEVEVIRSRGLIPKPGAKVTPAAYVKVYLYDGKFCIAKAKTTISRRTLEPYFQQTLVFAEDFRGKILQVAVWGDYGRMERKVFMGIAQVQLDLLNLSSEVIVNEWYKLFHSSSVHGLVSTASSPGRKEPEQNSSSMDRSLDLSC